MPGETPAQGNLRPALFALCFAGSVAAAAEPAPVEWAATAGVRHRTLSEWSATGTRLLTEKGAMPRVQLSAQLTAPSWPALAFEAGLSGANLDYRGQTQSGVPLTTTSRHADLDLAAYWRPFPAAAWGEAWLGLGWLQARRDIASSPIAGGLDETSSLVLPGIRWRSPAFAVPHTDNAKFQLEAQWRTSVRHRLEVDYLGVFDNSSFRGGRRSETVLGLSVTSAEVWRWSLEWSRSRQSASSSVALYRAGALVGSVSQPRVKIDDVSLSLTRRF
jgi:hypothetical protein